MYVEGGRTFRICQECLAAGEGIRVVGSRRSECRSMYNAKNVAGKVAARLSSFVKR